MDGRGSMVWECEIDGTLKMEVETILRRESDGQCLEWVSLRRVCMVAEKEDPMEAAAVAAMMPDGSGVEVVFPVGFL